MKTKSTKRVCRMCEKKRDVKFFHKRINYHGTNTQYYVSYCRDCMKERTKAWVKKNKKKFTEYQRVYQNKKYHEKKNESSKRKLR